MDHSLLDQKIKTVLDKKSGEARVDSRTNARIKENVLAAIEEEMIMTKKTSDMKPMKTWKKTALVAAAICAFGTMTAIALGRPYMASVSSSHTEEVHDYATAVGMQKTYDSAVKVIETFSNGYTFDFAVPAYAVYSDAQGKQTSAETNMWFTYSKDGLDSVDLSFDRDGLPASAPEETLELDNGIVLGFHSLDHKFVPVDYEVTEEDQARIDAGELNLAYGAVEVQTETSLSVSWTQNDVNYLLFTFEDSLTADEMFEMAKEIAE